MYAKPNVPASPMPPPIMLVMANEDGRSMKKTRIA